MAEEPIDAPRPRAGRPLLRVAFGLLLLLNLGFVVMYVLGSRLPETHRVSLGRRIEAPVDEVWSLLRDFETQAAWRSDTSAMIPVEEESGEVWAMTSSFGEVRFRVEEESPPLSLVTRIVDHAEFGGTWTYALAEDGAGATSVTITEDGEIHGTLFRFFAHHVFGLDRTLQLFLDDLERTAAAANHP